MEIDLTTSHGELVGWRAIRVECFDVLGFGRIRQEHDVQLVCFSPAFHEGISLHNRFELLGSCGLTTGTW